MRIFLRDSTLVMDWCWEAYRLARWQMESDRTLRWREDASDIRATICSLHDKEPVLLVSLRSGSEEQHCAAAPVPYVCPDLKRQLTTCASAAGRSSEVEMPQPDLLGHQVTRLLGRMDLPNRLDSLYP
jgi:hypothetical protein